jgi:hypothetical protein
MPAKDLPITQGSTFSQIVRWEVLPIIYKPIVAISNSAPVSIVCPDHGLPSGWRATVVSVDGMPEINAASSPPRDVDYRIGTVVDSNTVEFNSVNSSDYGIYTSGGYLQYNTPKDLAGYIARMTIRDKVGGTELIHLVSPTDIVVDNATKTITVTIAAAVTAGFTWTKGVYDLELESPTGEVTALLYGKVTVKKEVTTT